jgi:hypothetical protein
MHHRQRTLAKNRTAVLLLKPVIKCYMLHAQSFYEACHGYSAFLQEWALVRPITGTNWTTASDEITSSINGRVEQTSLRKQTPHHWPQHIAKQLDRRSSVITSSVWSQATHSASYSQRRKYVLLYWLLQHLQNCTVYISAVVWDWIPAGILNKSTFSIASCADGLVKFE